MTIEILDVPPSQNIWEGLAWTMGGRMKKSSIKKKWKTRILKYGFLWKTESREYAKRVRITYYFPDHRRRDKQNWDYFKPIPDGLTDAGIIKDDNDRDVDIKWVNLNGTGERKTVIEVWG